MKRAAIYLRVSTVEQTRRAFSEEGYSIEAQREACTRKAEDLGAEIAGEYVDRGESARSAKRPELQALMARLRDCDLDYVIVHKLDRLARNLTDHVAIVAGVREAGAELISVMENIDDTPLGEYMQTIFAANAQLYSANLSHEAKKGLHKKAKLGGTPSLAPIGYLNIRQRDEATGIELRTVVVDEARAPHIRWAFAAYASGAYTLDTLHGALDARGLRTRRTPKQPERPLSRTQLSRLLANPYYIGTVRYGGIEYEGRHPALIDSDTFSRGQHVLSAHAQAGEKDRKHHHYLKGSLRCHCGERLTFVKGRSHTGRRYDYFAGLGRLKGTGCQQAYLPVHQVETEVEAKYAAVKINQLGLDATSASWRIHLDDVRDALDQVLAGLRTINAREVRRQRGRIEAIRGEQQKLLQAYYADALPLDLLKGEQARLGENLAAAEGHLARAEADLARLDDAFNRALDCARALEATYASSDGATRRQWNQALFTCFRLDDDGELHGELREEFQMLTARSTPARLRAEGKACISSGLGSNMELSAEEEGFEPPRPLPA